MTRELTKAAECAKEIRGILKVKFPGIKFKVRSDNYSMGDSVGVSWINGPTRKNVEGTVTHFQYGHFNGMEDIYEHSNCREDIPQTKWLSCDRDISDDIYDQAFKKAKGYLSVLDHVESLDDSSRELMDACGYWTAKQYLGRYLSACDLTGDKFRPTMLAPDVWNNGVEPSGEVQS